MTTSGDRFAALREKNFLLFTIGSLVALIGRQMLTVAVGWEIYERTHSALALGIIGLVQFVPVVFLTLPAGHVVDHFDRRKVLIGAQIANAIATLGLIILSLSHGSVHAMYACLALAGISRAFNSPANAALQPQIVSEQHFTNAVTWGSLTYQAASILGPALGGLLIGLFHQAATVYVADFVGSVAFWIILLFIQNKRQLVTQKGVSLRSLISGVEFVWNTRIILAAITLDMFAVLFGGAVALLPLFAKDILHVGPTGLGWLQAAPSIGAIAVGYTLTRTHNMRRSGPLLLWMVAGFGLVTILFGVSKNFLFSFSMLLISGAFDNVSVVIRQSLVQLRTPDEMRGRVSAINFMFIGTSNELGGFESGVLAQWFGPVFSVVFGGCATIATVLATALFFPQLRKLDQLREETPTQPVT